VGEALSNLAFRISWLSERPSGHYACVAHEKGEAVARAQQARYQPVHLRCGYCERLVEARDGAAGKAFICFDCVDAINRLRAESSGSSAE
jgi:hypothetical protein